MPPPILPSRASLPPGALAPHPTLFALPVPALAMDGEGGGGAVGGVRERTSATVDIERFKYGVDDFEEWVELLETAITLATGASDARHETLCKKWLPLKLDAASRAIYKQLDRDQEWVPLKTELKKLLIDPQDAFKWQAKRSTIKWDGKESFHALASRIISAVAKYDGELPDPYKQREYFFRFRGALPREYQNAIDMGCGPTDQTLQRAKDLAQRMKMTQETDDKGVTFAAAYMEEKRTSGLEIALAKIDNKLDSLTTSIDTRFDNQDKRIAKLENYIYSGPTSPQYRQSRPPSPRGPPPRGWSPNSPRGNSPYGNSSRSSSPYDSNRNSSYTSNQRYDNRQRQSQPNSRPPPRRDNGSDRNRPPNRDSSSPRRQEGNRTYTKDQAQGDRGKREDYRAIQTDDEQSEPEEDVDQENFFAYVTSLVDKMKVSREKSSRGGND